MNTCSGLPSIGNLGIVCCDRTYAKMKHGFMFEIPDHQKDVLIKMDGIKFHSEEVKPIDLSGMKPIGNVYQPGMKIKTTFNNLFDNWDTINKKINHGGSAAGKSHLQSLYEEARRMQDPEEFRKQYYGEWPVEPPREKISVKCKMTDFSGEIENMDDIKVTFGYDADDLMRNRITMMITGTKKIHRPKASENVDPYRNDGSRQIISPDFSMHMEEMKKLGYSGFGINEPVPKLKVGRYIGNGMYEAVPVLDTVDAMIYGINRLRESAKEYGEKIKAFTNNPMQWKEMGKVDFQFPAIFEPTETFELEFHRKPVQPINIKLQEVSLLSNGTHGMGFTYKQV